MASGRMKRPMASLKLPRPFAYTLFWIALCGGILGGAPRRGAADQCCSVSSRTRAGAPPRRNKTEPAISIVRRRPISGR